MLRLHGEEPDVVVGDVRRVHLPGLFRRAPFPRRAPDVRAFHAARHVLDLEPAAAHAAWGQRQFGEFILLFFNTFKLIQMIIFISTYENTEVKRQLSQLLPLDLEPAAAHATWRQCQFCEFILFF